MRCLTGQWSGRREPGIGCTALMPPLAGLVLRCLTTAGRATRGLVPCLIRRQMRSSRQCTRSVNPEAIAEILLRDVPEPSAGFLYDWERDRTSDLHVSAIVLPRLHLVNLTSTGLRAAGLRNAGLFDFPASAYPATRARALAIWQNLPKVQGLCLMPLS